MVYQRQKQYRLPDYDYAQSGAYFITFCTHEREHLLGEVRNGKMYLSEIGKVAQEFLLKIPAKFANSTLDAWVIMPNHVHLILVIHSLTEESSGNAPRRGRPGAFPLLGYPPSEASIRQD